MCSREVNVIALVENLELVVPNRLPVRLLRNSSSEQSKPALSPRDTNVEAAAVKQEGTSVSKDAVEEEVEKEGPDEIVEEQLPRIRCRRTRKRKRTDTVVRRRNPTRSAAVDARKEAERLSSTMQTRLGGGRRRAKPKATESCPELQQPHHEIQWKQWPVHGMHERPVYHPEFGLAAEYNGRLFASFDGEGYREVIDLEIVRVDPRLESLDGPVCQPRDPPLPPSHADTDDRLLLLQRGTAQHRQQQQQQLRALEQLRSIERLRRLRLQQLTAKHAPSTTNPPKLATLPLCDVQAFKNNANGKLFFVKASNRPITAASSSSSISIAPSAAQSCGAVESVGDCNLYLRNEQSSRGLQGLARRASYQPTIPLNLTSDAKSHLGQVLDLSKKQTGCSQKYKLGVINVEQTTPVAATKAASAINLVRYFQNFGADGSIDLLEEPKNLS